jgi:succinate-semialdehyde dehydrogenase / glutarate-semialdehyde dehydrogenase
MTTMAIVAVPPATLPVLARPDLFVTSGYVGGVWIASERTFPVDNPATGGVLAQVADLGANSAESAIGAAVVAQPDWARRTAKERASVLRRWFELILLHRHDLAVILTSEQGKPLAEALGEIAYAAAFIEWFAEEGKRAYGDVIPAHRADHRLLVLKHPVGVVGAITPWNFPAAMITRKAGSALAAGCAMVLKPSELSPLTALALAKLGEEAGLPSGVFNVIPSLDAASIGTCLTGSKSVRKISFTGSTAVGKLLLRQSADTVKKVTMELGGNAPFIVFDDADVDEAVAGAIASKFRNAGQTCVAANRFLFKAVFSTPLWNGLRRQLANFASATGWRRELISAP